MSFFHFMQIPNQAPPSPVLSALVDAGVVFGFTLFSALVTLSAVAVRADPFIALYGPLAGAGLAFFYSLKTELAKAQVLALAATLAKSTAPVAVAPTPGVGP